VEKWPRRWYASVILLFTQITRDNGCCSLQWTCWSLQSTYIQVILKMTKLFFLKYTSTYTWDRLMHKYIWYAYLPKWAFLLWKLWLRIKSVWKKLTLSAQFRLIDLFLALTVYFPAQHTLHKSQVGRSSAMQWWACTSQMSATSLPAESSCKTCEWIVLRLGFVAKQLYCNKSSNVHFKLQ